MKINLTRNKADVTQATRIDYQTSVSSDFGFQEDNSNSPLIVLFKILIAASGLVILMGYESFNIGELKGRENILKDQTAKIQKEIKEKEPVASKAEEKQAEIRAIESRINAIKSLSKQRLREIKAIDYIQNIIPERVWLTKLEFQPSAIRIEGGALGDEDLTKFTEYLEGKSFFKDVVLLQAVEKKAERSGSQRTAGTYRAFVLTSNLLLEE